jgi:NitT/TauT family transport system substrate-binding protein
MRHLPRRTFLRLTGTALAVGALPRLSGGTEKVRVRIGHLPITDHLTIIAAARTRFERVALEPVKFASWPELAEGLKGGAIEGAFALTPMGLALRQKGVPVKLILLGHRNGSVLTVAPEVRTAADLKGKTIAIPSRFSTHNILLRRYLGQAGIDTDTEVKLVELPPPEMVQALATKRIAAYIVAEPFGAQAELRGVGKVLVLSKDIWPDHICCTLLVREDLISRSADAVQELVTGLTEAGRFASSHPGEAAQLSKPFLGQDPKVVLHVLSTPGRVTYDDLVPTVRDVAATQDDLLKYRITDARVDVGAFVDDRFARAARRK